MALYAGRMIRLPVMVSSIRWAAHPAIREMANMGVYRSAGIPSILYTNPEYMSTLAQMALSLVLKSRKISGVSRSMVSSSRNSASISLPWASSIALRLRITSLGSDRVYTACPMP